jgi:enterochelin esterase-like enzyme
MTEPATSPMKTFLLTCAALFLGAILRAEDAAPKPAVQKPRATFVSPEVLPDKRVTFRVAAPNAKLVELDATPPLARTPMAQETDGLWTVTVGPIAPGLYHYWIRVDGVSMADAMNPLTKPAIYPTKSLLEVPGDKPELTEFQDVPHGVVRMHTYLSRTLGKERHVRVYTPPGYRDDGPPLPVLYLYPGSTNNEASWMGEGRAHFIMDNLLAAKRCVPMLVVMPEIHAVDPRVPAKGKDDRKLVEDEIVADIIPLVDANYRTIADRDHRALAGLSKGGGLAESTGIIHHDLFAWLGIFSGAWGSVDAFLQSGQIDAAQFDSHTRLLWLGVGTNDLARKGMEEFHAYLDDHHIHHTWHLVEGIHEYTLWRPFLAEFASLLFQPRKVN